MGIEKELTCYIFSGAPMEFLPLVSPEPGDLILCADGGYRYAKVLGLKPDYLVGDFDTLPEREIPQDCQIRRHPIQKDDTDTMLAVKLGLSLGFRRFVLYGAIGGRLDHTIANVQTLLFLYARGAEGVLIGERNEAMLHPPGRRVYPARPDSYFSVFALTTACKGVCLEGVEYPLQDAELTADFPLGVSNHITGEQAAVTLAEGMILLVFSRDRHQSGGRA